MIADSSKVVKLQAKRPAPAAPERAFVLPSAATVVSEADTDAALTNPRNGKKILLSRRSARATDIFKRPAQ